MPSEQHEQNLAHRQRRNELLMECERFACFTKRGETTVFFASAMFDDWSSTDLRIIADELDRRNKQ